jgi:PKD repeat protein
MSRETTVRIIAWTSCVLLLLLPAAVAGVDCAKVNVSPVADFEYSVVPAETAPVMVNFFSGAKGGREGPAGKPDGIESYHWNFGDGSVSEEESPMHTYASGSARSQEEDKPFSVTLTVKTGCGRSAVMTKNVSVYCLNHTAGFAITQPAGEGPYPAPVALFIRDTSLHAGDSVSTWHYTVWDAGMTKLYLESMEKDPTFIIRNGGSYVIRQEIFKACCYPQGRNVTITKTIEVTGSSSADTIPMDTIPCTTAVPEYTATTTQDATPLPAVTVAASQTTAPVTLPADSAPGTGTLSLTTSPAGARVFVDDVLRGSTPATLPGIPAGNHHIRFEKDGFRAKTVLVEIGDRQLTEYSTSLETDSGITGIIPFLAAVLVIAAGAGAAVWFLRKKKRPRTPDMNEILFLKGK